MGKRSPMDPLFTLKSDLVEDKDGNLTLQHEIQTKKRTKHKYAWSDSEEVEEDAEGNDSDASKPKEPEQYEDDCEGWTTDDDFFERKTLKMRALKPPSFIRT